MSQHVEWMNADCIVTIALPGEVNDSNGNANEKPALVLGFDDLMVIEGTKHQLLTTLARATALVNENLS